MVGGAGWEGVGWGNNRRSIVAEVNDQDQVVENESVGNGSR